MQSNQLLKGRERCDRYRDRENPARDIEIRLYSRSWPTTAGSTGEEERDDQQVTRVSYFRVFSPAVVHGHVYDSREEGPPSFLTSGAYARVGASDVWEELSVANFYGRLMKGTLPMELPKPTLVLHNEGIWTSQDLSGVSGGISWKTAVDSVVETMGAFKDGGVRVQWKTTSWQIVDEARSYASRTEDNDEAKAYAKSRGIEIVDAFEWHSIFVKKLVTRTPFVVDDALTWPIKKVWAATNEWQKAYPGE